MRERSWPAPVERVAEVLRRSHVEARIEEFGDGTPRAEDAARAVGCHTGEIVKSLVFSCDGRWVLAMVPGDRRVDRAKVAAALGCQRVAIASASEVERVTGFVAGAVAPFPLPGVDDVLIERMLLSHDSVWIGAGSQRHLAALAPSDLVHISRARAVDLVSENPP